MSQRQQYWAFFSVRREHEFVMWWDSLFNSQYKSTYVDPQSGSSTSTRWARTTSLRLRRISTFTHTAASTSTSTVPVQVLWRELPCESTTPNPKFRPCYTFMNPSNQYNICYYDDIQKVKNWKIYNLGALRKLTSVRSMLLVRCTTRFGTCTLCTRRRR